MRYISVFSGVEAASVAWEPLGWEPVAFCEVDDFPSAVLAYRFPQVPNLGDITKVDWSEFADGSVDVVIGGSPCQSFSVAGKREGLKGESGLMFEYIRCVREIRPRYFVWENVPGAFSSEKGEAFRQLLAEMDDLGYGLAWRVLDAQFFGVAQRRRRVFLVGSLGNRRAAEILFEPDGLRWDHPSSREKRKELTRAAQQRAEEGCGAGRVAYGMAYKAGAKAQAYPISEELHPTLSANRHDASVFIAPTYCIDGSIARGARFNQNGKGWSDTGECYTLNTIDIPAVAAPNVLVFNDCITSPTNGNKPQWGDPCHCLSSQDHPPAIVMASGQSNAEIEVDMAPAQSARQYKDPQIVCMADDNANAAIDVDLCGSLKVGGGRPCIAYRATETTSSAHSVPVASRASGANTSARAR